MKKLLGLFGAFGLITTASATVVACQEEISADLVDKYASDFSALKDEKFSLIIGDKLNDKKELDLEYLRNQLIVKYTKFIIKEEKISDESFINFNKLKEGVFDEDGKLLESYKFDINVDETFALKTQSEKNIKFKVTLIEK